jgi:hypothetical protein
VARVAADINSELKRKRKHIAIPDLFIAATAMANNLPLATLNKKHFERIDRLAIIDYGERTTIACQKSDWTNNDEADEQFVNCISLINNSAANASPSVIGKRCEIRNAKGLI